MKQKLLYIFLFYIFFITVSNVYAVENPINVPNNRIGIHILFSDELTEAAKLVNANGGDWGYVVIPIQSGDRDFMKWQKFMDTAKQLHVIPIIRIATEGSYFRTKVWRKPTERNIVDFANFLESLSWPTKNRYVVIFNEVNRASEWGGELDPKGYANILSYSVTVFKSRNKDFFIISAGLDNAAPNKPGEFMNVYDYFQAMNRAVPGIFNQIDGFSSHSYPNPGFAQSTAKQDSMSIATFRFERELLKSLRANNSDIPVFITETGWSLEKVADKTIADYYKIAFSSVWNDGGIVVVAPFVLYSGDGPFTNFSFLTQHGEYTEQYKTLEGLPKIKGSPILAVNVLGEKVIRSAQLTRKLDDNKQKKEPIFIIRLIKTIFNRLFKI